MRGVAIERFKGKRVPTSYLDHLFSKIKVRNLGIITFEKGKIIRNVINGACTTDLFNQAQDFLAERPAMFICGEYADGVLEGDLQPITLVEDGDTNAPKATAYAILTGDYPGYNKNDSHTAEHHVVLDYLFPKIDELNNLVDADFNKLMKALEGKSVTDDLVNLIYGEGSISMAFEPGKFISKSKGNARMYEWGWASDHLGWGTAADPPAPVAAPTGLEGLAALAAKPGQTVVHAPIMTDNKPPVEPPKTATADIKPAAGSVILHGEFKGTGKKSDIPSPFVIPPHIASMFPLHFPPPAIKAGTHKDKHRWYKNKGNYLATDDEIKAGIGIWDQKDMAQIRLLTMQHYQQQNAKVAVQPGKGGGVIPDALAGLANLVTGNGKDTSAKHIPAAGNTGAAPPAVPFLSKETMTKMEGHLKKLRDDKGNAFPDDPVKYYKLEPSAPTFLQKSRLKGLSQTFPWTFDDLVALAKDCPDGIALLVIEHREELQKAWAAKAPAAPAATGLEGLADLAKQNSSRKAM